MKKIEINLPVLLSVLGYAIAQSPRDWGYEITLLTMQTGRHILRVYINRDDTLLSPQIRLEMASGLSQYPIRYENGNLGWDYPVNPQVSTDTKILYDFLIENGARAHSDFFNAGGKDNGKTIYQKD